MKQTSSCSSTLRKPGLLAACAAAFLVTLASSQAGTFRYLDAEPTRPGELGATFGPPFTEYGQTRYHLTDPWGTWNDQKFLFLTQGTGIAPTFGTAYPNEGSRYIVVGASGTGYGRCEVEVNPEGAADTQDRWTGWNMSVPTDYPINGGPLIAQWWQYVQSNNPQTGEKRQQPPPMYMTMNKGSDGSLNWRLSIRNSFCPTNEAGEFLAVLIAQGTFPAGADTWFRVMVRLKPSPITHDGIVEVWTNSSQGLQKVYGANNIRVGFMSSSGHGVPWITNGVVFSKVGLYAAMPGNCRLRLDKIKYGDNLDSVR